MISFLNSNVGALTVVFNALVTVATIVYAVLTSKLVSETRRLREVQTEPRIEVSLKCIEVAVHLVRLQIVNIGQGPAYDVRFSLAADVGGASAQTLVTEFSGTKFLSTGLNYFGPGEERFSEWTDLHEDHDGKLQSVLKLEASYKSGTGKAYRRILTVDMSEYKGAYLLGRPHLYSIATSIEKIERSLDSIARGRNRLSVNSYSSSDRTTERSVAEEERRKRQQMSASRTAGAEGLQESDPAE